MSPSGRRGQPDRAALIAFGLIVLLAGSNAVAVRFSNRELAPFWGAAVRFGLSAAVFWVAVLAQRAPLPKGRALTGTLVYGLLNFGAGYAFAYWGLVSVEAGLGQVVLALVPLSTLVLASAHGLERLTWRGVAGAVIAVAGIAVAFARGTAAAPPLPALLALLASAACISEAGVVAKRFPLGPPAVTNAVAMTAGTAVLVALSTIAGEPWRVPVATSTRLALVYLVFVGSVAVFYLFLFVIRHWTASATSYQFVLFPFVTVVVAAWLAGETVTPAFFVGGALVLAGVWLGAIAGGPREEDVLPVEPS